MFVCLFVRVKLLYNVVLVSAEQQSEIQLVENSKVGHLIKERGRKGSQTNKLIVHLKEIEKEE